MKLIPLKWHPAYLNGIIKGLCMGVGPLIPVHQQDDFDLNKALADANDRLAEIEQLDFYYGEKINQASKQEAAERLHYWQSGGDSFTCILYRMFQKADPSNRTRLAMAFPAEAIVFTEWENSMCEQDFFSKYGLIK